MNKSRSNNVVYEYKFTKEKMAWGVMGLVALIFGLIGYGILSDPRANIFESIVGLFMFLFDIIVITHIIIFILSAKIRVYTDRLERVYTFYWKKSYYFSNIIDIEMNDSKTFAFLWLTKNDGSRVKEATLVDYKPLKKLYRKIHEVWDGYKKGEPIEKKKYVPPGKEG